MHLLIIQHFELPPSGTACQPTVQSGQLCHVLCIAAFACPGDCLFYCVLTFLSYNCERKVEKNASAATCRKSRDIISLIQ